jgi:glycosyltransferase involved in cell wall biosynthesis
MRSRSPHALDLASSARPLVATGRIAVLIPCYNEAASIEPVVQDFRRALPHATIYVYDNNSTDNTGERAQAQGAVVRRERLQGKGNVIRRMFADIEADAYVLVDGDATYDAADAPTMVEMLLSERLDMVNGARVSATDQAYRPGHKLGNTVLTWLVRIAFGAGLRDMLSGYKVLSRRFVKSMPLLSTGFEVETELAVHALSLRMPVTEWATRYRERPAGSNSKLRTVHDGVRILRAIVMLVKEERPLLFFTLAALLFALASVALGTPVVITFLETGLVPRLPTAVLATGVMLLSFLSLACGLILDTVTRGRKELKRMAYLAVEAKLPSTNDPPHSWAG